jgi:hypothetical protein
MSCWAPGWSEYLTGQMCAKASHGLGPGDFGRITGLQSCFSLVGLVFPRRFHVGVGIQTGDEALQEVGAL